MIVRRILRASPLLLLCVVGGVLLRPALASLWRRMQPADGPARPILPRLYEAHVGQFQMLDRVADGPSIVYLGDSVTDWVCLPEFLRFESGSVLNRAISGDTTTGVLERIERSFPANVRVCFLLIGINDLQQGDSPEAVAERIGRIYTTLTEHYGAQQVVVESLLPAPEPLDAAVRHLNAILTQQFAAGTRVSFLDLNPLFRVNGVRDADLYVGDVHSNARGALRRLRREVEHLAAIAPELGVALRCNP